MKNFHVFFAVFHPSHAPFYRVEMILRGTVTAASEVHALRIAKQKFGGAPIVGEAP
jgi:hypothetical protein